MGEITESVYASGVIKSEHQYQVFPKASGILQQLFVDEGDLVNDGQLLFSIYNENSALSRQNAALLAEYNDFDNNSDRLKELKLNSDIAKTKFKTDSTNFQRQKNLFDKKVISKAEFEMAELQFESAQASYKSSLLRYQDLKRQLTLSDMQSKRNLAISQNMENDFLAKSEIKGKVFAILKEKGEMVSPQMPVAIVGDANNFVVDLLIDETDISNVKIGQQVVIKLDSYKNKTFRGVVTKINPYLNEKTKSFTIEARFVDMPKVLYPNLSVEANIVVETKTQAMVIPRRFLIDEHFVELENGKKVKLKIGLKDLEMVEVLSGLHKNDVLVIEKK